MLNLTHTELMNFMERVLALLPLEAEEDAGPTDPKGAPKVGITSEQVRDAQDILREMNDLQMASKMKAETKPKKEADRKRDALLAFIIDAWIRPVSCRSRRNKRLPSICILS